MNMAGLAPRRTAAVAGEYVTVVYRYAVRKGAIEAVDVAAAAGRQQRRRSSWHQPASYPSGNGCSGMPWSVSRMPVS